MFAAFFPVWNLLRVTYRECRGTVGIHGDFLLHVTWHLLYCIFVFQVRRIVCGRLAMGKPFLAYNAETAAQIHGKRILKWSTVQKHSRNW